MGVSVIIPSFERPTLLKRLLESVVKQTYRPIEVFVIDDLSRNVNEVEEVVSSFNDQIEITFLKNSEKKGAPYSRNRGIKAAKYDLIALVDDDDEWFPEKLERQVELFKSCSDNVGIVYTWTLVVDSNKKILRESKDEIEGNAKSEILESCFIPSPSVMVKKSALEEVGMFDETFPSCQDWDTWTRIIFKGYSVRVSKTFLTYYYKHDGPTIGTSPRAKQGFILFYQKHFFKLLRYAKFRHLIRLVRFKYNL